MINCLLFWCIRTDVRTILLVGYASTMSHPSLHHIALSWKCFPYRMQLHFGDLLADELSDSLWFCCAKISPLLSKTITNPRKAIYDILNNCCCTRRIVHCQYRQKFSHVNIDITLSIIYIQINLKPWNI
jgi:hypothetical protein